jgi:hypothetical protein
MRQCPELRIGRQANSAAPASVNRTKVPLSCRVSQPNQSAIDVRLAPNSGARADIPGPLDRDKMSYSFKAALSGYSVRLLIFEMKLENIILIAFRVFEFSYSLGHLADLGGG